MRSMTLIGLLALLVNQQPGDDTPRIGNCRTLPDQATCLTASSDEQTSGRLVLANQTAGRLWRFYSGSGKTQRLQLLPDGTVELPPPQPDGSGGLAFGDLPQPGPVRLYPGGTTTLAVFDQRHQSLTFASDAASLVRTYTRVCWNREDDRRCVSMEELLTFIRLEGR